MSKLDELIKELCPNGVDFFPLWKLTIWDKRFNTVDREKQEKVISYPYLLANELFPLKTDNGNVFLLSTGAETGWTTEELAGENLCEGEVVTIPWGKSRPVKEVMKYYKGKFVTADNRIATSIDTSILLNKYLYYALISKSDLIDSFYRGSSLQHPHMGKVLDLKIPVPPLPVQEEIVRILDKFTTLTAELTARRKQYEYYRDLLLTFASSGNTILSEQNRTEQNRTEQNRTDEIKLLQYVFGYAVVRLGEIATYADTRIKAKDIVSTDYVSVENLLQNKQGVNFTDKAPVGDSFIQYVENDILIGNIRPYLKKIWKADRHGGTNADVLAIRIKNSIKDIVSASYLYFQLSSEQFFNYDMQNAKGAKMPRGSKDAVMKYEIILPAFEEQERIVKILDRFDSLCNDISSGLPAEIEARQKQYEYFRDKLLTFDRKDA